MNDNTQEQRRVRDRWHVGKEIPLALIMTIIAQTGAGVWWAAGVNSELRYTKESLVQMRAQVDLLASSQYRPSDAARDMALQLERSAAQERRLMDIETRMRDVERAWRVR